MVKKRRFWGSTLIIVGNVLLCDVNVYPRTDEKLAVEPRGSKLFQSIIAPAVVWPSLISDAQPQTVPVMTLI